jgi:acyl-CoA synthetase (AMP-forming)/AMP-acid ligase II
MHVRDLLESRVAAHPNRIFLIFKDVETSYQEFDTMVNRVANGLRQRGTGDRVCVMLSNCPPFLYTCKWLQVLPIPLMYCSV